MLNWHIWGQPALSPWSSNIHSVVHPAAQWALCGETQGTAQRLFKPRVRYRTIGVEIERGRWISATRLQEMSAGTRK